MDEDDNKRERRVQLRREERERKQRQGLSRIFARFIADEAGHYSVKFKQRAKRGGPRQGAGGAGSEGAAPLKKFEK